MNVRPNNIPVIIDKAADMVRMELMSSDEFDIWRFVELKCEQLTENTAMALEVIATYGLNGALCGGVDYEDSPMRLFEESVYERVVQLLWEKDGIEVID